MISFNFKITNQPCSIIKTLLFFLVVFLISCNKDSNNKGSDVFTNSGFETTKVSFKNLKINSIAVDDSGYKWIGTASGLYLFNNTNWYKYSKFDNQSVNSILKHGNEILIASSSGSYKLSISSSKIDLSQTITRNVLGIPSDTNFVYGYGLFDKTWIGSPIGLSYFDGSQWKQNGSISSGMTGCENVRSMAVEPKDIFFGTYGKYLYHIRYKDENLDAITGASQMYGGATNPIHNFNGELTTDTIYCMCASSDTSLWFGSETGLTRNKGETTPDAGLFQYFLRGQHVFSVIETSDKKIVAGSDLGLNIKSGDSWTNYNTSSGLPDNSITSIAEDKDKTLWIGTPKGLSHFVNGAFTNF